MIASVGNLQEQEAALRDEQLELEREMVALGQQRYEKQRERGGDLYTTPGMKLMRDNIEQVASAIRSDVEGRLGRPGSRKVAQLALVDRRAGGPHVWYLSSSEFVTTRRFFRNGSFDDDNRGYFAGGLLGGGGRDRAGREFFRRTRRRR